jgi:predicted DNA-binding transcriptional regulator AlpA
MSRLLTAEQLAERWQVGKGWIYAKTRSGEIPKVRSPAGTTAIDST